MNNWFEVKVKYTKMIDDGTFKRVSESFLVAAMTFGDAEERIYEELGNLIRGEFIVTAIKKERHVAPQEPHAPSASNPGAQSAISHQYSRQILPKCLPAA